MFSMYRGLALWEEKGPPSTLSPRPCSDRRACLDVIFISQLWIASSITKASGHLQELLPRGDFIFFPAHPVSEAGSPSCTPSLHVDLPAGSLCNAPILLGLSSTLFIWTEESFTVVDVQMVICGILYLAVICVFFSRL